MIRQDAQVEAETITIPIEALPEKKAQKDSPWKLIALCCVFIGLFGLFVFFPPAKKLLYRIEDSLLQYGWYGNIFLVLFVGLFIVPVGLPYTMFQMMFAFMVKSFWVALILTSTAQTLGSAVAFCLTRYVFKDKLKEKVNGKKIFRGIEAILMKDPVKFSLILNITNLPLIIKNYALALPANIGFKVYILTATFGAVFTSAPQIYIFQQAEKFGSLNAQNNDQLNKAFTIITTILSVLVILYVSWYTKKVLSQIEKEAQPFNQLVEQNIENIEKPEDKKNEDAELTKIEGIVLVEITQNLPQLEI